MTQTTANNKKQKIALVLSGGGALGAAHIGVMKALEEKYLPEYFYGTSAGAIICAALACGMTATEISNFLKQKTLLKAAFDFSFGGSGIIRGIKILGLLKQVYKDRRFEDLPKGIKLRICATNFNTGEEIILKTGSIADAVRASLSIPGIFEPHWINNQPLVDGGLVANLPLTNAIKEYKGNKIIAIDVCSYMSKSFPPNNQKRASVRQSIERSLRIFFLNQQKNIPHDPRVTLIKPVLNYHSADILKLSRIEQAGWDAVSDQ